MARGERASWCVAALMVAVTVATANAATNHVVGGNTAWTVPPNSSFYSEWSSTQTFAEGDTLTFNFPTGIHNVIVVPKSGYDACSHKDQIGSTLITGPATVTISSPGKHYYICGVGQHCSFGQKLAISVAASAPSAPPSTAGGPTALPHAGTGPSTAAPVPTVSGPSGSAGNGSNFAPALPSAFRIVSLAAALSLATLLL